MGYQHFLVKLWNFPLENVHKWENFPFCPWSQLYTNYTWRYQQEEGNKTSNVKPSITLAMMPEKNTSSQTFRKEHSLQVSAQMLWTKKIWRNNICFAQGSFTWCYRECECANLLHLWESSMSNHVELISWWLVWNRCCFVTFLGIFPREVEDIIFVWRGAREVRLSPHEVRLKRTSENSKTKMGEWGWVIRLGQV